MTEIKAKLNFLRISPRKTRLAADIIRNKTVQEAEKQLRFLQKRAGSPLLKLLRSAVANARQNFRLAKENLYVKKITVDQGPIFKRHIPRARGMASPIRKKTSHITLVLDSKVKGQKSKIQAEIQKSL